MPIQQVVQKHDPYWCWYSVNRWNRKKQEFYRKQIAALKNPPTISVILPVYNTNPAFLNEAILSFCGQEYPHRELILVNDGSTNEETIEVLHHHKNTNLIRLFTQAENRGISDTTNFGVAQASGSYVCFLDHDDLLDPPALVEVALTINQHPEADIIYTDDDKITPSGQRFYPQFKTSWNPELLLSFMYIGHLLTIRKDLFQSVGGFRKEFDGAQDYDLVLRLAELTNHIYHIPKVLYHWRVSEDSTSLGSNKKPESIERSIKALQEALKRRNVVGGITQPKWAVQMNAGFFTAIFPSEGPKVIIAIPTRSKASFLSKCLHSIKQNTGYKNYEVVICANNAIQEDMQKTLNQQPYKVITINDSGEFNFSKLINQLVPQLDADYIVLLNDDTEILNRGWLNQLIGYMQFEGVGAVGGHLLYPNGLIQHAGLTHGYYDGLIASAFKGQKSGQATYQALERISRTCTAVTSACMLISKKAFLEVGGFSEEFRIGYNDADFCHKLRTAGYRIVYSSETVLIHHEASTRNKNPEDDIFDRLQYQKKYRRMLDPLYNPNLTLNRVDYSIESRSFTMSRQQEPIRVLGLAYNLNFEGSSLSQFEILSGLKNRGSIVPTIYCYKDGPLRQKYEDENIDVIILPSPLAEGYEISKYITGLKNFATFIQQTTPDVVYANTLQMFYGIDAAKQLHLPSIWNVREGDAIDTYFDHFGVGIAQRALDCFQYPYQVVFVSEHTRRVAEAWNSCNNFITITTGLPLKVRSKLQRSTNKLKFLSVGTVCDRKNQLHLVESIKMLPKYYWDKFEIVFVGDRKDTDYSKHLHQEISKLPQILREAVTVVDETLSTELFYQDADVFILTSRSESYPRTVLEAMAYHIPVIAPAINGLTEQVVHRVNGKLFVAEDRVTLISEMMHLIDSTETRTRYQMHSPLVLESKTSYEEMLDKYQKLFFEAHYSGESR